MVTLDTLRAKLRLLEQPSSLAAGALPFGIAQIDDRLPLRGLGYGSYHEVASSGDSARHSAAATLFVAGIMARTKGQILWCFKQADLFAPALAQVGLPMDRIIFVEANDEKTVLACFEEGLRHTGLAGAVAEVSKLSMTNARRLQLAAESSGVMGITIRRWWKAKDAEDYAQPTAARTRWRVTSLPSVPLPVAGVGRARWRVELMRCQAGEKAEFEVEACDETGNIHIPSNMANRLIASESWSVRAVV